jgi:hypothetical protein
MKIHSLAGGQINLWCDPNGVVCIKTVEPHGDPVELNAHEAEELAALLLKLADEVRG